MLPQKTLKHLNKLQQKKYREEYAEFAVEGFKGVTEALKARAPIVLILLEGSKREESGFVEIIKQAEERGIEVSFLGRKDIGDIKTTEVFPGIMAVIEKPDISLEDIQNQGPIICLNKPKDPGNLGTIIRSADWFGISNLMLSEDSVDPYNPKVVRSSMGSLFHVSIFESKNLEQSLLKLKESYKIIALNTKGEILDTLEPQARSIYLFGSESTGLEPELEKLVDEQYTIPGRGQAESLNLAVAAGILMSKI
ncbi:MAG: RNA methyltransferase [Candidatus Magasanikbacteria bacterium]|nr:RNA methyltransferase [Candidatus Magasanikbacteria bacterium]